MTTVNLSRLQIVGVKGHIQPGEVFVGGTYSEDGTRLTLVFRSSRQMSPTPRRCKRVDMVRRVVLQPFATRDGEDFYWRVTSEQRIKL